MISLLAGEEVMQDVIQTNNIDFGKDAQPKKIDMGLLEMSQSLKDQLELKNAQLKTAVTNLTRQTWQIRD